MGNAWKRQAQRKAGLAVAGAAASGVLLASGCGTGSGAATADSAPASPSTTAASTTPAPVVSSTAASPTPATSAPSPLPSTLPVTPSPSDNTCARFARHTFAQLTSAVTGPGGSLTVTGYRATVVCGGPDDLHYNVGKAAEKGTVAVGASIQVFPISTGHPVTIAPGKLNSYLKADDDTRIFLITGPLSKITALQEEFHP